MASTCTRLPTPSSSMVTYCVPRFSQVPGRMARVTSSPLPAFARMTEPSHEPGCRPHLSILTDLICPSYTCDVAFEGAPAVTSDARAHASPIHRRQMPAVLSRFIGPPPSLNSPLTPRSFPANPAPLPIHPGRNGQACPRYNPLTCCQTMCWVRTHPPPRPRTTYTASETLKSRNITCSPPLGALMLGSTTGPFQAHCS